MNERRKITEILTKGKNIQIKQKIPKQQKKILSTTERRWHKNIPTTRCKRNRKILDEYISTKKHNEKAEWINDMTRELEHGGPKAKIHIDLLKTLKKNIKLENAKSWWNTWFLVQEIHLHSRETSTRNELMLTRSTIPDWMTKAKTILIQKNPSKRTAPNNYKPITCLPMLWEIFTSQIMEEIYYSLISRGLFPEEHTACCKGSRGTAELLYQHILNESKTRR